MSYFTVKDSDWTKLKSLNMMIEYIHVKGFFTDTLSCGFRSFDIKYFKTFSANRIGSGRFQSAIRVLVPRSDDRSEPNDVELFLFWIVGDSSREPARALRETGVKLHICLGVAWSREAFEEIKLWDMVKIGRRCWVNSRFCRDAIWNIEPCGGSKCHRMCRRKWDWHLFSSRDGVEGGMKLSVTFLKICCWEHLLPSLMVWRQWRRLK